MFTIRKLFKVEYAHILDTAYSSCCKDCIHGHSGVIEVFFRSNELNEGGMVVDFGRVKDLINDYIQSFDHALILSTVRYALSEKELKKWNKKMMVVSYNPTAELMARDIYNNIKEIILKTNLDSRILHKVRFHETVSGWAEYKE